MEKIEKENVQVPSLVVEPSKEIREKLDAEMDKTDITIKRLCTVLSEGLSATKLIIDKYGDEHTEIDHANRHKFLITTLELKGILKRPGNSVEINNNFTFAQMVETAFRERK